MLTVCLLLSVWGGSDAAARDAGPQDVVVQVDYLNLRPQPAVNQPALLRLPRGSRLTVLEHNPDWLKVRYGEIIGYVRNRERYLAPSPTLDQVQAERESIEKELAARQETLAGIEGDESGLLDRLDALDRGIQAERLEIAALRRKIAAIESRMAAAEIERRQVGGRIERQEGEVARRLVVLYKLHWLGNLNVLASADSINDLVQRQTALERILALDHAEREALLQDYERWSFLQMDLDNSRKEELALESRYAERIRQLDHEKAARTELLEEVRTQKRLETAAILDLKTAADRLEAVMTSLTHTDDALAQPPPPGSIGTLKGLLDAPVKGRIANFFGPFKNTRYNVMNFRSGIDIKSERGEPVQAVFGGKVLFADWFKGYGNMLIIDHGHSYCTLYAHAQELFKQKGDRVEGGEVIATVGDSGSLSGPGLYFEIRHHGKPEDPQQWLRTP